jgi:hypothetical protein
MPGVLSPSTLNLYIAKAFVLFQRLTPVVDASPIHLGKLSGFEYTADVQIAEFYDESQGIRIMIDAAIQQVGGKFKATLNEATAFNFGLYLLGSPNYTTVSAPTVPTYGNQQPTTGTMTVVGTNGKGPRVQRVLTNVLLAPEGNLDAITRDYGSIPIAGRHIADPGFGFGATTWLPDVNLAAPTNWTKPFIQGSTNPGDDITGPYAKVGEVLYASAGQWTAGVIDVSATVQWFTNTTATTTGGTVISGQTNWYYTPKSADIGKYLYIVVTFTNSVGSTPQACAVPTLAVVS